MIDFPAEYFILFQGMFWFQNTQVHLFDLTLLMFIFGCNRKTFDIW